MQHLRVVCTAKALTWVAVQPANQPLCRLAGGCRLLWGCHAALRSGTDHVEPHRWHWESAFRSGRLFLLAYRLRSWVKKTGICAVHQACLSPEKREREKESERERETLSERGTHSTPKLPALARQCGGLISQQPHSGALRCSGSPAGRPSDAYVHGRVNWTAACL